MYVYIYIYIYVISISILNGRMQWFSYMYLVYRHNTALCLHSDTNEAAIISKTKDIIFSTTNGIYYNLTMSERWIMKRCRSFFYLVPLIIKYLHPLMCA